jgi:hypothetical protein
MSGSPPGTASLVTSLTQVSIQLEDDTNDLHSLPLTGSEGGSAIQGEKIEDKIEVKEDDWEHDPVNPRNWSPARKWIATSLVS